MNPQDDFDPKNDEAVTQVERFIEELSNSVFLNEVFLRDKWDELATWVQTAKARNQTFVDILERDTVDNMVFRPPLGLYHRFTQWRFKDGNMTYIVRPREGEESYKVPEALIVQLTTVMENFRYEPLSIDSVDSVLETFNRIYQDIELHIPAHVKALWYKQEYERYEPFLRVTLANMPGRLTPELLQERLRVLESFKQRIQTQPGVAAWLFRIQTTPSQHNN